MVDTISLMLPEETEINIEFINTVKERKGWKNLIHPDAKKYTFSISKYLSLGSSPAGKFLNIQLPQVFYGTNIHILNREEAYNSFKKIEKDFLPYISNTKNFTILDLVPTRVDLFKDIKLDYSYLFYEEPLKLLKGYKMDRKFHKNTILFKTQKEEVSFYDKKEQLLKIKKVNLSDIDSLMRVEIRLKKKLSIQKHLEIKTVQILLDNWYELDRLYNKYLDYRIFKANDFRSELQISVPNKNAKNITHSQVKNILYYQEMKRVCGTDIEKVKEYLQNAGYGKESIRKKLKEFQKYCVHIIEVSSEKKIIDLINEIREKLKE